MIWRAVDDAALMAEAEKLAAHLATQPTHALVLTRKALRASAHNSFDEQLDLERDLQRDGAADAGLRARGCGRSWRSARRCSRAPRMRAPADPAALARACADAMWADDRASPAMGMAIEAVAPGSARWR